MTTETREALKGLAHAVKLLAIGADFSATVRPYADRLIRALEQEPIAIDDYVQKSKRILADKALEPLRRPTANLISAVKLAVLANGGFAHKAVLCKCDSHPEGLCRYCAIHEGLTKAFTFLRALEQEGTRGYSGRVIPSPLELTPKKPTDFQIWRDEQLLTLRKLFNQRGPSTEYQSFPDFCREQWEGSDKGKVKV